jgi:hypothetical protein
MESVLPVSSSARNCKYGVYLALLGNAFVVPCLDSVMDQRDACINTTDSSAMAVHELSLAMEGGCEVLGGR